MMDVTSTAFRPNEDIPSKYTCDGEGINPPLSWSRPPTNAKSVAILVDDPDAPNGPFTHWLVTDLPPDVTSIEEAGALPHDANVARSDAGNRSYYGPCPTSGIHRYRFHVYALDTTVGRAEDRERFLSAIQGHILDEGELVASYSRH